MTGTPVLITGAARRIGKALALDLAMAGFKVAVHYATSGDAAQKVVKEITKAGGTAAALQADLLDHNQLENLVSDAGKALGGPIEVLINNAAAFEKDDLKTFDTTTYSKNMGTNLEAPLVLAQAFQKQLPETAKGNIINIIDQRVLTVSEGFLTYTLSKHALYAATRHLALECAPKIRVNAIAPGPTLQSVHQSEADFAGESQSVPLGQGPQLSEFSETIQFILNTPSITGQMITLDGGQHLL